MAEETKDSNVKSTIEAVTGLVKAVPIYDDALQPAAKQIGKSLETVTKVVNIALVPLKGLVWGYERIEEWINSRVAQKLENIPEENIITPPLQIAGPTIEALRYTGDDNELRELYANLLATSMDKNLTHKAHPGYVDIIKNITSDEALILKAFLSNRAIACVDVMATTTEGGERLVVRHYSKISQIQELGKPELVPSYIDNLCRLGLTEIPSGIHLTDTSLYSDLENNPSYEGLRGQLSNQKMGLAYSRKVIRLTAYGELFIDSVVKE